LKHEECGGNNIFHGQMKWNKGEGLQRSRSKSSLLEPGAGLLMIDLAFMSSRLDSPTDVKLPWQNCFLSPSQGCSVLWMPGGDEVSFHLDSLKLSPSS
jgi:hypothetical protein